MKGWQGGKNFLSNISKVMLHQQIRGAMLYLIFVSILQDIALVEINLTTELAEFIGDMVLCVVPQQLLLLHFLDHLCQQIG